MKRILSIMAAIVCLWGCGKDSLTDFESEADRYIGTYELADMHWEGSAIGRTAIFKRTDVPSVC